MRGHFASLPIAILKFWWFQLILAVLRFILSDRHRKSKRLAMENRSIFIQSVTWFRWNFSLFIQMHSITVYFIELNNSTEFFCFVLRSAPFHNFNWKNFCCYTHTQIDHVHSTIRSIFLRCFHVFQLNKLRYKAPCVLIFIILKQKKCGKLT